MSNAVVGMSFYEKAFSTKMEEIWGNTTCSEFVGILAFQHALAIFYENSCASEAERRQLLYEFCKPFLSTAQDSILNKVKAVLPTSNLYVKQVLSATCQLYTNAPLRKIIGKDDDKLSKIISDSDMNSSLKTAEELAKLCSRCLVRPYFNTDDVRLYFELVSPDVYCYDHNGDLYLHKEYLFDDIYYDCFHVWSPDGQVKVVDLSGSIIQSEMSKFETSYSKCPYLELRLNSNLNDADDTRWELVKAQLLFNRLNLMSENNVILNGFASPIFINMGIKPGDSIGTGKAWIKNDVTNTSSLVPPQVEYIDPPTCFTEINDYANDNIKNTLRAMNLPNSLIDRSANLQSGIAMEIDRQALSEERIADENRMRDFDKKLVHLIALVANAQLGTSYGDEYEVSIEYIETLYPSDSLQDYQLSEMKFNNGLIDAKTYLRQTTDLDASSEWLSSNEKAIEFIKANKNVANEINNNNSLQETGV